MSNVFISYRREDAAPYAGRLCDRLTALFGADCVFMDVLDIRPGQDFAQTIREAVAKCHVLLAVVGPHWLKSIKERAAGSEDFVEEEITEALRNKLTVIPVLVGGAKMPDAGEIPAALQAFGRHQAVEIRDNRFDDDFSQLSGVLRAIPGLVMAEARPAVAEHASGTRSKWFAVAAAVVALVLVAVAWMLWPASPKLDGAWTAEMHKRGQPVYRIRLDLILRDGAVNGTVEYPTGQGAIGEGKLDGPKLSFQTVHTPQFESAPATVRFVGQVEGKSIRLTTIDDNGVATGVAHRMQRADKK